VATTCVGRRSSGTTVALDWEGKAGSRRRRGRELGLKVNPNYQNEVKQISPRGDVVSVSVGDFAVQPFRVEHGRLRFPMVVVETCSMHRAVSPNGHSTLCSPNLDWRQDGDETQSSRTLVFPYEAVLGPLQRAAAARCSAIRRLACSRCDPQERPTPSEGPRPLHRCHRGDDHASVTSWSLAGRSRGTLSTASSNSYAPLEGTPRSRRCENGCCCEQVAARVGV